MNEYKYNAQNETHNDNTQKYSDDELVGIQVERQEMSENENENEDAAAGSIASRVRKRKSQRKAAKRKSKMDTPDRQQLQSDDKTIKERLDDFNV